MRKIFKVCLTPDDCDSNKNDFASNSAAVETVETTDCNNDDHVLDIDEEVLVQIPQAHLLDLMRNANSKTCTVMSSRRVFYLFKKVPSVGFLS